ncbi:MAG: PQQ-dependent sugar dehydrogenase [Actinomycetota bacterium]|nr:PQQ-dependent sugar dehydrogenase [Actinomycetota bacterium]
MPGASSPRRHLLVGTGGALIGAGPRDRSSLGGKVLRVDKLSGALAPGNALRRLPRAHLRAPQGAGPRRAPRGPGLRRRPRDQPGREVNLLRPGANGGWDPVPGYDERAPMTDLAKFLDANGGGADRILRVTPG